MSQDKKHSLSKLFDEPVKKLRKLCEEDKETKEKITGELLIMEEKYSLQKKKTHSEDWKIFNDSIHGHIELHPLLVKIIDTPQFQRLRNIKQLGAGYWVYPGASHNRFEHSIGVAYLAGCLVSNLQEKQPELKITSRDKLCVQIAGLCHDLGHGPFSHLFDIMFIPEVKTGEQKKWKHEQASVDMFEHMVKHNGLDEIMQDYGLVPDIDKTFIQELIKGVDITKQWTAEGRTEDKSFLYEIVSNKRNGIDVDKWDYFARACVVKLMKIFSICWCFVYLQRSDPSRPPDCHHLGISKSFDHQRLLKLTRVCKVKINQEERNFICFRDKEKDNIYDMFCTRFNLHRQAYQHKTVNIIEIMIKNALVEADGYFKISNTIDNMAKYTELTDHIFEKILYTESQNLSADTTKLKKAKAILQDIVNRRLPKFVGEATLPDKANDITQSKLKDTWKTAVEDWNKQKEHKLKADDFEIDIVKMDHGMKGKDLTENVYFYSKRDPTKAFKIEKNMLTSILPEKFYECIVRVYYKRPCESFETAQKCFELWSENNFGLNQE